ncbi:hypothetical protein J6590_021749 [Homalodisca vitripennis]|nr:hypothetical protein J6590_021749 [Homalodisca vitripennis]
MTNCCGYHNSKGWLSRWSPPGSNLTPPATTGADDISAVTQVLNKLGVFRLMHVTDSCRLTQFPVTLL